MPLSEDSKEHGRRWSGVITAGSAVLRGDSSFLCNYIGSGSTVIAVGVAVGAVWSGTLFAGIYIFFGSKVSLSVSAREGALVMGPFGPASRVHSIIKWSVI